MSAPLHLGPMLAMAAGLAVGLHVDGGDR
jgi:hypothetical protein